ncbi:MAG: FAD-dependent oxidoreductase [Eubacteriales bacterium]
MSNIYDLIIVGAGPAGLSAAIYMARAKYRVLVLEEEKIGGQITITSEVVNYPGVFHTSGEELTHAMHKQGENFGAEFQFAQVRKIDHSKPIKKITTSQGEFECLSVILALGANPRKLGFPGEHEFQGRGVAYCATCDGEFFKNKDIYVIGGGFAAVEEGIFLTKYASHVHMVVRGDSFSCAQTVADKVIDHPKVTVHFETEVEKVEGNNFLQSISLKNKTTGNIDTFSDEKGLGVFVFAGYVPNTNWLRDSEIALKDGYIVTTDQGETNIPGIFAAGDVRIKELRQVVTAVSDGATAATTLEKYVETLRKELDLPEYIPEPKEKVHPVLTASSSGGDFSKFQGNTFIAPDMAEQLQPIIAKMERKVLLKAKVSKNQLGEEIKTFVSEFAQLTDKIEVEIAEDSASFVALYHGDGKSANISYAAVPTGHEFNSFILGILQISAQGKPVAEDLIKRIKGLKPRKLQVMITLSCTMCPDVVQGCQRMAFENDGIQTEIIDINHHPEYREKYQIMSVPALVIDENKVHFGKKSLEEQVLLLEESSSS